MDNIPKELIDAIAKPYGYSVLVKGMAGSGKTTLVLELLSRSENPLYFSTRVSPLSLEHQFPWIKETIKPENMLDVTQLSFIAMDTEHYFESVIKFKDLPEFLQVIYHKTKDRPNSFVVIDAWSTLLKYSETSSIIEGKIESFLSEMVRQKKIKLFLVTETESETYLDYIVDGIITLKRVGFGRRFGKKRIREMHIEKLRGVEVAQHEYLFTLNNGRFRHFEPQRPEIKEGYFQEIPDPKNMFSSGCVKLDEILGGGFRRGSIVVVEIDEEIPKIFPQTLAFQVILNFLKNGRTCSIIPASGENAILYFKDLSKYVPETALNERLRIFEEEHELFKYNQPYIVLAGGKDPEKDFLVYANTLNELRNKSSDGHFANFTMGLDSLESRYPLDTYLPARHKTIEVIRLGGDLMFICIKKGAKTKQFELNQCDYHFNLCSVNGCIIIEILKPFFKYPLAVEIDYPKINLIPIL
ncbi:MAG: gas vesicle protein GvpD P-loop domain-containing protein [Candidatus Hodarchaeota archaeon]